MYISISLEVGSGVAGGGGGGSVGLLLGTYQGVIKVHQQQQKGGGGGRERKKSHVLKIFSELTQYGVAIPKIGYASYQRWSEKDNKQTKQKHTNSANFLAVPQ